MKLLRVVASNFKNCCDNFTIDFVAKSRKTSEDKEYELQAIADDLYAFNTVAFVGKNERAKTTLFNIITGKEKPDSGEVVWGVTASYSYFPKDHAEFFNEDTDLVEFLRPYSKEKEDSYLRGFLGRMLFSGEEALKKVSVLSGGEKVRLMFSRMMLKCANVIILDEPTNHLDIESITSLNKGMKAFKGVVLFSSYDYELINSVANRIIEFKEDGKYIDKMTTYDEYLGRE